MDKDKIQGAMILGLAAIVLILLKDRKASPQAASGQTYILEGEKSRGGGSVNVGGVNASGPTVCPCYY